MLTEQQEASLPIVRAGSTHTHGTGGAARPSPPLPVVALTLALGCGDADEQRRTPYLDESASPVTRERADDSLHVLLDFPAEVRTGRPVPFAITLDNVSGRDLTLYLTGRPTAFDIDVRDAAGTTVWRRLADATLTMTLRVETLQPGGRLAFSDRWDQRDPAGRAVPPGAYSVRAEVLTEGAPLASATRPLMIRQ